MQHTMPTASGAEPPPKEQDSSSASAGEYSAPDLADQLLKKLSSDQMLSDAAQSIGVRVECACARARADRALASEPASCGCGRHEAFE